MPRFLACKEVVENAVLFSEAPRVNHDKFDAFSYYGVTVSISGNTYDIVINVGKAKNDGTHHIYDITPRNKKQKPPAKHLLVFHGSKRLT